MQKLLHRFIYLLFFATLFFVSPTAQAHDLIPIQLQDYLASHPNATPQEIQTYFNSTSGTLPAAARTQNLLTAVDTANGGKLKTIWDFIPLGIAHVLSGTDHVLFVISLLLVFGTLKDILKLTGTFTVAHSITLILSGTLLLSLSSRIVEPLIALSIAYVAVTSVFLRKYDFFGSQRNKLITVFFFGLFHGFGFAGALKDLSIPSGSFIPALVAFNVGIEIGQLTIITAVLPILYLLRKKSWYQSFISVIAVGIGSFGLVWAVQRALGW